MPNIQSARPSYHFHTVYKTATGPLTKTDVWNTVISNYGQAAETTLTLPTPVEGMAFAVIISTTGNALHIKAGASDKIYLDGVALHDADKVSLAVPAVGNETKWVAVKTGASAFDWVCNTINGTWTDGGA